MVHYTVYRDDVEKVEPDEQETHEKIIELMTEGMHSVREKSGQNVRISHAKAFGLLEGDLIVNEGLPPKLAQGLFAQPGRYPVLVRRSNAPGEITDDSKVNTARGMAIKVFNVQGPKLPGHTADTQDFVLDTGKEFINSNAKAFLQTFKPNAKIAPKLSDTVKGSVSDVSRAANAALNAVGLNSEKLDFFGHEKKHPHGGGLLLTDSLPLWRIHPRRTMHRHALTNLASAIVISVEYRKAPEHKFPAAVHDAVASYRRALKNAGSINGDSGKIAFGGESAGGNLAAVICLIARDRGIKIPLHQLLVYPIADNDFHIPSFQEFAHAQPLNRSSMRYFFRKYLSNRSEGDNPYVSLLEANLEGLPPATIIGAEIDPLQSEGEEFANRLRQAGIPVDYKLCLGANSSAMGAVVDNAKQAAADLRKAFGK